MQPSEMTLKYDGYLYPGDVRPEDAKRLLEKARRLTREPNGHPFPTNENFVTVRRDDWETLRLEAEAARIIQSGDYPVGAGGCTECEDAECPGVVTCPQCRIGEHGQSAYTYVADHGMCYNCLRQWRFGEDPSPVKEEEIRGG